MHPSLLDVPDPIGHFVFGTLEEMCGVDQVRREAPSSGQPVIGDLYTRIKS